jgi:DNA-binding NtrC family response regulator
MTTSIAEEILLIEDNIDLCAVMNLIFMQLGFLVTICQTSAQAKNHLHKVKFDFIILDLILPDGPGLELLHHLKKTINFSTKVIISSGNIPQNFIQDPNIIGVFHKPYNIADLADLLERKAYAHEI